MSGQGLRVGVHTAPAKMRHMDRGGCHRGVGVRNGVALICMYCIVEALIKKSECFWTSRNSESQRHDSVCFLNDRRA